MIDRNRLRAPSDDGAVLIEPPAPRLFEALANPGSASAFSIRLCDDQTVEHHRSTLRSALGLRSPVIVTGHQAEFFHAGIIAKSIATWELAQRTEGTALFVTVASDTPKSVQLVVPRVDGDAVARTGVAIPGLITSLPVEHLSTQPRRSWVQFFEDVRSVTDDYDATLMPVIENAVLAIGDEISPLDAMVATRRAAEAAIGLTGMRDISVGTLSATPAFIAYFRTIACDALRFATCYNDAQAEYRARNNVRNRQRPVPLLNVIDGRVELPFWLEWPGAARRRLYVSPTGTQLTIFADREELGTVCETAVSNPLPNGWLIRPRALALSSFIRLFLADMFIHGIGGAKYDEMTDAFLERFFGAAPPSLACVTATKRLPLPDNGTTPETLYAARHTARDHYWNPQRRVADVPDDLRDEKARLIKESEALRAQQADSSARRRTFAALRAVTEMMRKATPGYETQLEEQVTQVASQLERDRIARNREYFFGLHSTGALMALRRQIETQLAHQPAEHMP